MTSAGSRSLPGPAEGKAAGQRRDTSNVAEANLLALVQSPRAAEMDMIDA